jgi:hypothetical protein
LDSATTWEQQGLKLRAQLLRTRFLARLIVRADHQPAANLLPAPSLTG